MRRFLTQIRIELGAAPHVPRVTSVRRLYLPVPYQEIVDRVPQFRHVWEAREMVVSASFADHGFEYRLRCFAARCYLPTHRDCELARELRLQPLLASSPLCCIAFSRRLCASLLNGLPQMQQTNLIGSLLRLANLIPWGWPLLRSAGGSVYCASSDLHTDLAPNGAESAASQPQFGPTRG